MSGAAASSLLALQDHDGRLAALTTCGGCLINCSAPTARLLRCIARRATFRYRKMIMDNYMDRKMINVSGRYEDDQLLDVLFGGVRDGLYNVRWDDETGEPHFQITRRGAREAVAIVRRLTGQDDHDAS